MESAATPRSKLPDVGTTIFTVIGELAAQHQALNLSQGAPNFACDPQLVDAAAAAMRAGHNQYASMPGLAALRAGITDKFSRLTGARYSADDEVTVVGSASQGLYAAISALVHPGDEVIYFEPAFDSYAPIVRLQGAVPVAIKLAPDGFRVDWDQVAAALTPRSRMIIVNTPHNPSATIFSAEDLQRLAAVTRGTGIVILSDEVYEHVVFDGAVHQSMARSPELAARSVIVSSFGKSFHVTGWRVGYCLAPAALMEEIRKVHQFMMFTADTPMQYAFAQTLSPNQKGSTSGRPRPALATSRILEPGRARMSARMGRNGPLRRTISVRISTDSHTGADPVGSAYAVSAELIGEIRLLSFKSA